MLCTSIFSTVIPFNSIFTTTELIQAYISTRQTEVAFDNSYPV